MATAKLSDLQSRVDRVRNICILAHVDHGKTTLADGLVASNGIISSRLAGQLRYMDSRPDEQERGITMKSSAISLHFNDYLINLIDSPGHVDFSGEVSTAVRLCDGGVIVVDVVEGVQPQTKVVLQQAWNEGIAPVLVLNKLDRLIVETRMSPMEAYLKLSQVLETVNAIIGELFASDVMGRRQKLLSSKSNPDNLYKDWSDGLEEVDDSDLYFAPDRGNVVFASAVDGWAFGLEDFAKIYAEKLGFSEAALTRTLWGDFFINAKTKRIMNGAQSKGKKPLFVQMILENIWAVYECAVLKKDREKLTKVVSALNIKVNPRELNNTEQHTLMSSIFSKWLPLTRALLRMVVQHVPSPDQLTEERVEKLMSRHKFASLPPETRDLKRHFLNCSADSNEAPLIVFVSKMFPVETSQLPENRPKPLTKEELAARRDQARQRHAERMAKVDAGIQLTEDQMSKLSVTSNEGAKETAFVAFARVFSGTLRPGSEVYVLGPKYDPGTVLQKQKDGEPFEGSDVTDNTFHVTKTTVRHLYLLLGRDLEALDRVPAGNIIGIGGLEKHVLKSATLSSSFGVSSLRRVVSVGVRSHFARGRRAGAFDGHAKTGTRSGASQPGRSQRPGADE